MSEEQRRIIEDQVEVIDELILHLRKDARGATVRAYFSLGMLAALVVFAALNAVKAWGI